VANIKSQIKRNKQNETRHVRNKSARTSLKTDAKKVRTSMSDGDLEAAREQLRSTARQYDKAVSSGAVHKRTAARRKSRLARLLNTAPQG
jgi:small subunit ribosomal protein S20